MIKRPEQFGRRRVRGDIAIIIGGLLVFSSCAQASTPPTEYKCDAPAAQYDQIDVPLSSDQNSVRGTLVLNATRADAGWMPKTAIYYMSDHRPLFGMMVQSQDLRTWMVYLVTAGETRVIGKVANPGIIPFRLDFGMGAKAILVAGKLRAEARFRRTDKPHVLIGCSTASVVFQNLEWGPQNIEAQAQNANK